MNLHSRSLKISKNDIVLQKDIVDRLRVRSRHCCVVCMMLYYDVTTLSHDITFDTLHCVFRSPFSGRTIVSRSVCFEKLGNIWDQWVIGIGIGEKTADRKQNLADGQGRTPLIFQNVQTDTSI